jgi:hypothetical protein
MTPANVYDIGDLLVVLSPTFVNPATGAAVDPSTVTFQFTKPDGTETTSTYLSTTGALAITRVSTGHFKIALSLDRAGPWYYRWAATGTGQAAERGAFDVVGYAP